MKPLNRYLSYIKYMNNLFKNPYLNSIFAELYIILIVLLIRSFAKPNTPDTFFDAIVAFSIFTLSAAVMGYLFFGKPLLLFIGGDKKKAVTFFYKTVLGFTILTILATVIIKFFI